VVVLVGGSGHDARLQIGHRRVRPWFLWERAFIHSAKLGMSFVFDLPYIVTHPDAGLHALRHTFLTEAGEYQGPL